MKINKSFFIGLVITILLLGGAVVAFYLSQQNQDVRQRASEVTTGPFGKAIVFDGATSQIYIGSTSAATLPVVSSPFSISMWIKPEYLAPEPESESRFILDSNVLSSPNPECKDQVSLYITPNVSSVTGSHYSLFARATTASDQQTTIGNPNYGLPYNQWSYIVFSVDSGGTAKIFANGTLLDTTTLVRNLCLDANNYFYLGSGAWPHTSTHYKGQIDELTFSTESIDTSEMPVPTTPNTITANTTGLYHFDNNLSDEFSAIDAPSLGSITYADSTVVSSTTPPVCEATLSTCSWDPVDTAVSYHYTITEEGKDTPIAEADVQAPTTSTSFTSDINKTYTCEVTASSACGTGPKGSATATCSVSPTPTPTLTPTGVPPTPTATGVPPTPTLTPTGVPPTPTATGVPPTATTAPIATNTPIPGVATDTPTPTMASPGSPIQTFAIAGGIFLTIIGALLLFAL